MSDPSYPVRSFTATGKQILRVLKTDVKVSRAFDSRKHGPHPDLHQFKAIWDTGATGCTITAQIVKQCGLKPISMTQVQTAGGLVISPVYLINLYLPNMVAFQKIMATEGDLAGAEMLVGMDIINKGDFAVTNKDGQTVFSFRIPSLECIDFNKAKPPACRPIEKKEITPCRNSKCPCGSGKKYKQCCGRV